MSVRAMLILATNLQLYVERSRFFDTSISKFQSVSIHFRVGVLAGGVG